MPPSSTALDEVLFITSFSKAFVFDSSLKASGSDLPTSTPGGVALVDRRAAAVAAAAATPNLPTARADSPVSVTVSVSDDGEFLFSFSGSLAFDKTADVVPPLSTTGSETSKTPSDEVVIGFASSQTFGFSLYNVWVPASPTSEVDSSGDGKFVVSFSDSIRFDRSAAAAAATAAMPPSTTVGNDSSMHASDRAIFEVGFSESFSSD
mmetsp:Transcript_915/g.1299  ORF Transcript_915/g.1299 Transcript_915/m.1299 type:complete len:207 (+) Transcript_915:194-814(+)